MIQNQYQYKVFNATAGTAILVATGGVTIHTVNFPKATAGISRLTNGDGSVGVDFPAASIGCMILDASFPTGANFATIGADTAVITYQIP